MATFVSLNARGLRSSDSWQSAFNIFRRARFDIICLQETHWTADIEMQIKRDWIERSLQTMEQIYLEVWWG